MDGEKEDAVLDHAIYYVLHRTYPGELTKEEKRAVRKRATNLIVEKGEVFLKKKERKVCVSASVLRATYRALATI